MKKIFMGLVLFLSACSQTIEPEVKDVEEVEEVIEVNPIDAIDLSLKPDETGEIMVLMYHSISTEEGDWARTVDNFKKDLQTLYEEGFRPISLTDFIEGNITTEAGYTPVVLTFDDGRLDNFKLLEDGSIDPECAVGVLVNFHETHPDFPLEASFFLTGSNIFGQSKLIEEKLNMILDLGMDLGNHTMDHPNFKDIKDVDSIQYQLGGMASKIESYLHSDYKINTLALTYGSKPKDEALMKYMVSGTYNDIPYENITLLKVGSNPADSPYVSSFDPLNVPRVRASEMNTDGVGLYDYLRRYTNYPDKKFISDGNANIITIPSHKEELLNPNLERQIYAY